MTDSGALSTVRAAASDPVALASALRSLRKQLPDGDELDECIDQAQSQADALSAAERERDEWKVAATWERDRADGYLLRPQMTAIAAERDRLTGTLAKIRERCGMKAGSRGGRVPLTRLAFEEGIDAERAAILAILNRAAVTQSGAAT